MNRFLDMVDHPSHVKKLTLDQLHQLGAEIREELITVLSKTGGHLGPNLGVVELTVALHRVFTTPKDKFVWDVSHQSYVHKLLTGEELDVCCHSNLLRAVAPYHLFETDVHDVLNVFQVTGLTADTHQYFVKPCPAKEGDYFEFFAEIDLLCAISTCPHGDMSAPTWGADGSAAPVCRPIAIETHRVRRELLEGWRAPSPSD